jgi:hypothetical protein
MRESAMLRAGLGHSLGRESHLSVAANAAIPPMIIVITAASETDMFKLSQRVSPDHSPRMRVAQ